MSDFTASLLREKFSIHDSDPDNGEETSIIALSNRMVLEFKGPKNYNETIIIRAQNMHSCVRMAARLVKTYKTSGPILNRTKPFDWEAAWDIIVNDFEHRFNPQRWIAIYHNGQIIYQAGEHHLLLDVIEKCNARNKHEYEKSIPMAEDAFKQAGKIVRIGYDSNVALVINLEKLQGRFGVIMRGPSRTTTFNFSVHSNNKEALNYAQCMASAASFLEGIQLAFTVGMNHIKMRHGIIERFSTEEKMTREGGARLGRLASEIVNLERTYNVRYRPEKPEFHHLVTEAEKLGEKIIEPPQDQEEEDETMSQEELTNTTSS